MKYIDRGFSLQSEKLTKGQRNIVYSTYGMICYICGRELREDNKSIDHIHPIMLGGSNNLTNLRPCCTICNKYKSNRLLSSTVVQHYVLDMAIDSYYTGQVK